MMTSTKAFEILRTEFDNSEIEEVPDNPSCLGWFLFRVDGVWAYVTAEGDIVGKTGIMAKINQQNKQLTQNI